MSLAGNVDVVVVGFGIAGATAAWEAARSGAGVLVLDGRSPLFRRRSWFGALDRSPAPSTAAHRSRAAAWASLRAARLQAQTAALAAGVRVRAPATVCELLVDGGCVTGVGYSALEPRSTAALTHSCLNLTADGLRKRGAGGLGRALTERADGVWERASVVESTACASVVLAIDPSGWEFVGPAVWASVRAAERGLAQPHPWARAAVPGTGRGGVDSLKPAGTELSVRLWCASQSGGRRGVDGQAELRISRETGAVLTGDGHAVPGLYSAVRHTAYADFAGTGVEAVGKKAAGARRAGRAAAAAARAAGTDLCLWPGGPAGHGPSARATR
ncbi:hypothetical protein CJD44_21940 [Streptomyces sp. alain-838]|nr:FAD-binding protein [Streptomyces sp. alain-838]PAK24547.1 hypothetical protein CJD44_21940 [Streptomyces sp. alain-838]